MDIHILGGFLGCGKTTLLMQVASKFTEKGKKIAILVNEAGESGVDGTTIGSKGYDTLELPEGCICCTLAGTLIDSVVDIDNRFHPDVLIVEPTGLAFPYKIKEALELANGKFYNYSKLDVVAIIDAPRFDIFVKNKKEFYIKQLTGADIVAVNKMDIVPEEAFGKIRTWVNEQLPGVDVYPMSAKTGMNVDKVFGLIE